MRNRWVFAAAATATALGVLTASPNEASAQMMTTLNRVTAFPQGTIGGGLMGLELVVLIEGAAGLHNPWIMLGTGLAGAVGGTVGGYFMDQALDGDATMPATIPPQGLTMVSSGFLIVGLGLIIPTAIVFTGATMYRPPASTTTETDDAAGSSQPLEESGGPSTGSGSSSPPADGAPAGTTGGTGTGATPTATPPATGGTSSLQRRLRNARIARSMHTARPGIGMFPVGNTGISLGLPSVSTFNSVNLHTPQQSNVAANTEWRITLLNGTF